MRFDPSLFVNRLQVLKGSSVVYDERFHVGLNMIRSDGNSRGKSTIADLIFFSLGGDLRDWKPEAASCDKTLIEVEMSGALVSLCREIKEDAEQQPMWIYFGSLEASKVESEVKWERYSYRRYADRESFTQVIFRQLRLEDTPTEDANITINQILRLLYVDQLTPVNRIFRFDDRDSPLRRQAIGDLLCGIYDNRIYPSQMKIRQLEKDFAVATSQLSSLLGVLRRADEKLNFTDLLDATHAAEREKAEADAEIARLKASRYVAEESSSSESATLERLKRDLDQTSITISDLEGTASRKRFEIADAEILIGEIKKSLRHLDQAQAADQALGPLVFPFCPSCFSPIEASFSPHLCHLCKMTLDPKQEKSRFARMRNELEVQLKESLGLQEGRAAEYRKYTDEAAKLNRIRTILSSELLSMSRNFTTEIEARIDTLTRRMGYLDRELLEIEKEQRLGEEVARLAAVKEQINKELSDLRSSVQGWIKQKTARQNRAYQEIARFTANILNEDVQSDIGNVAWSDVYFDFAEDRVEIKGKSSFSASSLTIIRNAFHLALLAAASNDRNFNYPRFILMDNIEDKGMTPDRSMKFQRTLMNLSMGLKSVHQIIFTTSMPEISIDKPPFIVGEKYTADNMSLKVK